MGGFVDARTGDEFRMQAGWCGLTPDTSSWEIAEHFWIRGEQYGRAQARKEFGVPDQELRKSALAKLTYGERRVLGLG